MPIDVQPSFSAEATLEYLEGGDAIVRGRLGALTIRRPSPGVRAALDALLAGGATEGALAALAGADAVLLFYHLERAANLCLLRWTTVLDDVPLLTLSPLSLSFSMRPRPIEEDREYRLSRFAYCRANGDHLRLECPLAAAVVLVHDRRVAALLFDLARPLRARALAERAEGLSAPAVFAVLEALALAEMLTAEPEGGAALPKAEIPPSPLRQWEFHDLLFHARSRGARSTGKLGGTYRFKGEIPPLPAVKPPMSEVSIDLFRPDIEALRQRDVPFTEVLERRRSSLSRGASPLTAQELGELLFRSARVRGLRPSEGGELSDRPYPGAGARYELELYPVVNQCEGIPAGMYHYCPAQHRLERISEETKETRALLSNARVPERSPDAPEVLIVIAARFQRVSWKYEAIAYSLILKDVGVLLQTMYLVAAAMPLTACAIGWGDAGLFCRAAGTEDHAEASVGELALGGRPG